MYRAVYIYIYRVASSCVVVGPAWAPCGGCLSEALERDESSAGHARGAPAPGPLLPGRRIAGGSAKERRENWHSRLSEEHQSIRASLSPQSPLPVSTSLLARLQLLPTDSGGLQLSLRFFLQPGPAPADADGAAGPGAGG